MELVTEVDRAEIASAKAMIEDARKIRNRVMARIRKRRQRAKQSGEIK